MKKIYFLSSCNTCIRIMNELQLPEDFVQQDIKNEAITADQLDHMKSLAGSYESLFSRRAMLFRQRNLGDKDLKESDYRELILDHYTFLKRPVIINGDAIFIGNSKKVVEAAKASL